MMGREVVVAITLCLPGPGQAGSKLDFGPWEQIFYGEFDGRRRKRVLVKIIGEKNPKANPPAPEVLEPEYHGHSNTTTRNFI